MSGVLGRLLEYWSGLPRCGESLLPARVALHPCELFELMPRMALLKRLDRYNVQASMMNLTNSNLLHNPLLGINAFDLTAPAFRECRAEFYEAVLDQPAVAHLRETVRQQNGKPANVKSLYLPLADRNGQPTYIIACTVYEKRHKHSGINDRLVMDHANVRGVRFIDIGGGIPTMRFANPLTHTAKFAENRWWDRFVPARRKTVASEFLNN
ncbi:MAG: PAS domain-containing protein [Kordiimonadaceae bacterium]|nr:PAS domain-containing protein [Kordiimonadaceae bacterium]